MTSLLSHRILLYLCVRLFFYIYMYEIWRACVCAYILDPIYISRCCVFDIILFTTTAYKSRYVEFTSRIFILFSYFILYFYNSPFSAHTHALQQLFLPLITYSTHTTIETFFVLSFLLKLILCSYFCLTSFRFLLFLFDTFPRPHIAN